MNDRQVRHRIETTLGSQIRRTSPLAVGFGLLGFSAELEDGRHLAVKAWADAHKSGPSLALEGYMLGELRRLSELPVPFVHMSEPDLLVMDFIENDGGGITRNVEHHAAQLVAALHATPRDTFGYARDTLIGPLPQPNPESARWVPFFRDHRLLYMARAALQEGRLPATLFGRIETLAGRLEAYLFEPPFPSLLHGDLWTGNMLVLGDQVAGFIDPAVYCGHPEIELAFGTMFGTFGDAFFDAYESLAPLESGFREVRRDIYNLYPTLVHVRLFGAGYLSDVERTLAKLGI